VTASAWLEALDAYASDIARLRRQLGEMLDDAPTELGAIGVRFEQLPGDLPPELATYARAVVADAMVLEEEMAIVQRGIGAELGRARRRSIASVADPTGSRFDARA